MHFVVVSERVSKYLWGVFRQQRHGIGGRASVRGVFINESLLITYAFRGGIGASFKIPLGRLPATATRYRRPRVRTQRICPCSVRYHRYRGQANDFASLIA